MHCLLAPRPDFSRAGEDEKGATDEIQPGDNASTITPSDTGAAQGVADETTPAIPSNVTPSGTGAAQGVADEAAPAIPSNVTPSDTGAAQGVADETTPAIPSNDPPSDTGAAQGVADETTPAMPSSVTPSDIGAAQGVTDETTPAIPSISETENVLAAVAAASIAPQEGVVAGSEVLEGSEVAGTGGVVSVGIKVEKEAENTDQRPEQTVETAAVVVKAEGKPTEETLQSGAATSAGAQNENDGPAKPSQAQDAAQETASSVAQKPDLKIPVPVVDVASLGKGGGLIGDDDDKVFIPQASPAPSLSQYTSKGKEANGRVALNKYDVEAWKVLVSEVQSGGMKHLAAEIYERLLEVFPTSGRHWLSYANVYVAENKKPQAIAVLERGACLWLSCCPHVAPTLGADSHTHTPARQLAIVPASAAVCAAVLCCDEMLMCAAVLSCDEMQRSCNARTWTFGARSSFTMSASPKTLRMWARHTSALSSA
jgi:hypothetical protein